ncbi:MAG: potassium transporter TrkG [Anaerovoracaceae bacterium]
MRNLLKEKNENGKLMILIGIITMFPVVVLPFYPSEVGLAWTFLLPGGLISLLGFILCIFSKRRSSRLTWQENLHSSSMTVLFCWSLGFVASALPFYLSGQMGILGSLFESISGWTTTGHSVMDVSKVSHIFLFHRSLIQFIGGLGFVMMMVMIVQSKQAMNLFHAEGHTDNLAPNLKKTARTVFSMFMGFLVSGVILYRIFGMPIFDGICHTMSALSTAGFSTQVNSIGTYDSVPIEIITMVLMIIGIVNFAVLLLMLKGKFRAAFKVTEIKFSVFVMAAFFPFIGVALFSRLHYSLGESMRKAVFNGVSAITTTGYATDDFGTWPPFAIGMMILLMLIGGGIGSTAGGIKLIRAYLLLQIVWVDIKKRVSSKRRVFVAHYNRAQGRVVIDNSLIKEVLSFVACYLMVFIVGSLLLTLTEDCSLSDAMFDFSSSLGGVGLTTGITGAHSSNGTLIVEMIGMVLGRLEIFIVLIGIYSSYSVLKNKIRFIRKKLKRI